MTLHLDLFKKKDYLYGSPYSKKQYIMGEWLGSAIAGGSGILGGTISALQQRGENRRNRNFAREMAGRSEAHNLEMWNLNNEYNNPQNQRLRLEQAGLNPALMYGSSAGGAAGNSGSASGSGSYGSANSLSSNFGGAIQQAGASFIDQFLAFEAKEATVDNLKRDGALKSAQGVLALAGAADKKTQTKLTKKLMPWMAEAAEQNVRKMSAETDIALSREERAKALHSPNVKSAIENVLRLRLQNAQTKQETSRIKSQIQNIDSDTRIKKIQGDMWQRGISPSDNALLRIISSIIGPGTTYQDIRSGASNLINSFRSDVDQRNDKYNAQKQKGAGSGW